MGVKVTFTDKGLGGLTAKFTTLKSLDLTVGVQGKEGRKVVVQARGEGGRFSSSGSTTRAMVAAFNEFGTAGMPARPFIRSTFFEKKPQIDVVILRAYTRFVATKASAKDTLEEIGSALASMVKNRVNTSASWARANAPSTIARKGPKPPLHDSGRLSRSISWAVRGPGGSIISEGAAR